MSAERDALPALISVQGLGDLYGYTATHIRTLMREKGAPDPVPVEGTMRAAIYLKSDAVRFLSARRDRPEPE